MIASPPRGLMLFGIEPELDCAGGHRLLQNPGRSDFVVAFSPFMGGSLSGLANVVLPIATFMETSGTFVNAEGRWQSFDAVARPVGESRPAWKVLRVLGNRLGMPDCDYASSEAVRDELRRAVGDISPDNLGVPRIAPATTAAQAVSLADLDVPMYRIDALVRRAVPLQQTDEGRAAEPVAADRRRA
jgi:NADH-quinone oxidoreductase subunit G